MKIFLDLDGVFADCHGKMREYCPGMEYHTHSKEIWSVIDTIPKFFRQLEVLPDSTKILDFLFENVNRHEIEFLTALPLLTGQLITAQRDKVEWVHKNLTNLLQVHCVHNWSHKKYFCRSPFDILVDDAQRNINEWVNAGGIGILHTDVENTIEELKRYL